MITTIDKAIAALIVPVLSLLVLFHAPVPAALTDPTTITLITGVITGIVTYFVPNKAA